MVNLESGYLIEVRQITEENRFDTIPDVRPFHDLLKLLKGREERELYDNVSPGTEVILIKTDEPEPKNVAVMVQRLKVINMGGEQYFVLMRLLRASLLPGHDFAKVLTNEPIERLRPDAITGRTQNPIIPATDLKSPYIREENMYPWGPFYTSEARELLVAALAGESRGNALAEAHRITGVCREAYPKGETRLFDPNRLKGYARRFYKRMVGAWPEGLGAKLEEGDGVRYTLFPDYPEQQKGRSRFVKESRVPSTVHMGGAPSRLAFVAAA